MRLLVKTILERRHDVTAYESVDEAIEQADWSRTDVAIIDVMMPHRSGDYLVLWLADEHPHVRRIVCSAMGQTLDLERFALAHEVVTKPFTSADLEKALA